MPSDPPDPRPRPDRLLGGPAAWRGAELRRSWIHDLRPHELRELARAAGGKSLERILRAPPPLPRLEPLLARLRAELLHGRGFVVLRGLAAAGCPTVDAAARFVCLGAHLGRALPQNARGDLLGHVRDEGRDPEDPAARIYQTNARQGWHTDSADVAALLCLRPARSGGRSSLVSAVTLHDVLRERAPDLLPVLFEDFCTDHRGEHRPGAPPWFTAPILSWFAGELSILYQRRYIESAQRFPDAPRLTPRQRAALDALDVAADDPALHLSFELDAGDVLLLHNHQLLHDRTAFVDERLPERRRHLLRLWLCPPAGRPLPASFAERFGGVAPGDRGGVRLPGVRPVASLER